MKPLPRHYELISAMQKYLRRGMEAEAGQAFFELADDGQFAWALNRLLVTAHEDIGLGDVQALILSGQATAQAKEWFKAKKNCWRLAIANTILILCRAKKSRLADHFQAACRGRNVKAKLPIPDFALDKHTRRGKKLGRGIEHFRQEASKLVPEANLPDTYKEEAYAFWDSLEDGEEQPDPEAGVEDAEKPLFTK